MTDVWPRPWAGGIRNKREDGGEIELSHAAREMHGARASGRAQQMSSWSSPHQPVQRRSRPDGQADADIELGVLASTRYTRWPAQATAAPMLDGKRRGIARVSKAQDAQLSQRERCRDPCCIAHLHEQRIDGQRSTMPQFAARRTGRHEAVASLAACRPHDELSTSRTPPLAIARPVSHSQPQIECPASPVSAPDTRHQLGPLLWRLRHLPQQHYVSPRAHRPRLRIFDSCTQLESCHIAHLRVS
jgi:hypothetical protein